MSYSKFDIEQAAEQVLNVNQVKSIGLARAVNECAIQLFLNEDSHPQARTLIREALSDLRESGSFRFVTK